MITGNKTLLDSYGGVTAALKRAIELQPLAEDRPFRVVIDSYSTWQSTRLWGSILGLRRAVPCRSRSVR